MLKESDIMKEIYKLYKGIAKEVKTMEEAILYNRSNIIIFECKDYKIRIKGPYSLEYFSHIKEWDKGYIVVMTKYKHSKELIEEYIDLEPILDDLYIDKEELLKSIKGVKTGYDQY